MDSAGAGAERTRSRARGAAGAGPAPEGACPCRRGRRGAAGLGWERHSWRRRGGSCEDRLFGERRAWTWPRGTEIASPDSSSFLPAFWPWMRSVGCSLPPDRGVSGQRADLPSFPPCRFSAGAQPSRGRAETVVHLVQQTFMPCLLETGGWQGAQEPQGPSGTHLCKRESRAT